MATVLELEKLLKNVKLIDLGLEIKLKLSKFDFIENIKSFEVIGKEYYNDEYEVIIPGLMIYDEYDESIETLHENLNKSNRIEDFEKLYHKKLNEFKENKKDMPYYMATFDVFFKEAKPESYFVEYLLGDIPLDKILIFDEKISFEKVDNIKVDINKLDLSQYSEINLIAEDIPLSKIDKSDKNSYYTQINRRVI